MRAKRQKITKADVEVLEKRVIAQWVKKYTGKKRRRKNRSQDSGVRGRETNVANGESRVGKRDWKSQVHLVSYRHQGSHILKISE